MDYHAISFLYNDEGKVSIPNAKLRKNTGQTK